MQMNTSSRYNSKHFCNKPMQLRNDATWGDALQHIASSTLHSTTRHVIEGHFARRGDTPTPTYLNRRYALYYGLE